MEKMNILLVDDHPMTLEGYSGALGKEPFGLLQPVFTKVYNCEAAYHAILNANVSNKPFDVAIVDNTLPAYPEKSITSGIDVALFIQEQLPYCKIIMITAHTEVIIIYDLAKKVRPDGLIIKNDVTPEKLREAVTEVLKGNTFQSPLVKNCISEIWKKEIMIEDYNRQILFYLSKGFKIKDLEQTIFLTNSAIEKRISRMKKAFDVDDDTSLVREAIKHGFI